MAESLLKSGCQFFQFLRSVICANILFAGAAITVALDTFILDGINNDNKKTTINNPIKPISKGLIKRM